jgi:hypothetical protein
MSSGGSATTTGAEAFVVKVVGALVVERVPSSALTRTSYSVPGSNPVAVPDRETASAESAKLVGLSPAVTAFTAPPLLGSTSKTASAEDAYGTTAPLSVALLSWMDEGDAA